MENDNIDSASVPGRKIYKDRAITTGTYLGGPLVAAYFLGENFKTFNEPEKAKKTWLYAVIFTLLLFIFIFIVPDTEKIPKYLIPLSYTVVVHFLVKQYQEKNIISHVEAGGAVYSWGRVIGFSLLGCIITFLPVFLVVLFYYTATEPDFVSKNYGALKHEISYIRDNLTSEEADKIAAALTKTTFFDDTQTKYVYVKKIALTYEIHISVDPTSVKDPEVFQIFKGFRNDLQTHFKNNKIVIVFITDAVEKVVGRVE